MRGRKVCTPQRFCRLLRRCAAAHKGLLLIARGEEVTPALLERMCNFAAELAIREPVRMILQTPAATTQPVLTGSHR